MNTSKLLVDAFDIFVNNNSSQKRQYKNRIATKLLNINNINDH